MSELRKDPISGSWVIIAAERGRPLRPEPPPAPPAGATAASKSLLGAAGLLDESAPNGAPSPPCPLCPGNESLTPHEVLAFRPIGGHANDARWSVRVVPSPVPALRVESPDTKSGVGPYDRRSGLGAHEIIVESPAHVAALEDIGEAPFDLAAQAWQERIADLSRDMRLRHAILSKSVGAAAGARVHHAHSQLLALPIVPLAVQDELAGFEAYARVHDRCVLCDVVQHELSAYERLIHDNAGVVVVAPYASRVPFELWVIPKAHAPRFDRERAAVRSQLGAGLYAALRRLRAALGDVPYRWSLHTAPLQPEATPTYHWHLRIRPLLRGGEVAGAEGGVYVNPVSPETAAELLREAPLRS